MVLLTYMPSISRSCGVVRVFDRVLNPLSKFSHSTKLPDAFTRFTWHIDLTTFPPLAFSSYGGFWFSYAIIFIPGSGIIDAYQDTTQMPSAVAIYLFTWFMVTVLLL